MVPPCRKCGATRAESVRHRYPLRYSIVKVFGYRLRLCARCNRLRLIPQQFLEKQASELPVSPVPASAVEQPLEPPNLEPEESAKVFDHSQACPDCGATKYHRSRRRWYEHLMGRPPMARCRVCDHRFPYPLK
jgi:hypothetical protein